MKTKGNISSGGITTMTLDQLQTQLKKFGDRSLQVCGHLPDGQPLGPALKKFFTELLDSTSDAAKIAARNEFLARAEADPVARKQLCAIRVETVNNYVLASVNIMAMFFDIVTLAEDERPVFQNTTDQQVKVGYIGQDGGTNLAKVVKNDDEFLIPLQILTTDIVRYRRFDVYRGKIVDVALKVLRLAYDLKNQMDDLCYQLLTATTANGGAFGAFSFTNPKRVDYTFVANTRINTNNLPTTNDIVLGDNGANTTFRFSVFQAAKKYGDQWAGAFPEGDLSPTGRILIPGSDASDIATQIVPTGNTNNKVADDLLENGYATIGYLGRNWTLVTDNTLPPKSCLVEFNRKPGRVYLKPAGDRDVVKGEEDYTLSQNNEEHRWMQKVFGAYINSFTRINVARITYQS